MTPDERPAGHHFYPNGDLLGAYHAEPFIVYRRVGFRHGEKILLESWAERRCEECGCPEARYHAMGCSRKKETT